MIENPFKVGEHVLVSRAQDGENHEEGKVVDAYSIIIGDDERPMVCVEFEDGKREFHTATEPDVLPIPSEDAETEDGGDGETEAAG
jgi:hypothetical protein